MNETELNNLISYNNSMIQEISTTIIAAEEGGFFEQGFTSFVADILSEAGETENVQIAYDQYNLGKKRQHKINAYSIAENYETIDLFTTIASQSSDSIETIPQLSVNTAAGLAVNFFKKSFNGNYKDEIEESSDVFNFAYTLAKSKELRENLVRINVFIITNGVFNGKLPPRQQIEQYSIYFKVIDIRYLYNFSRKNLEPIEINFENMDNEIFYIKSPASNDTYQTYLAIFPGIVLAKIYEQYGSRLLEQNVRSFLQFTGKINKGIRETIKSQPQMFLAYNNGIAATAKSITTDDENMLILKATDFQIVNGGQTTASIYHTWKKDKADISQIYVQVKLSIVKKEQEFNKVVSNISKFANTQNKVSIADLSANIPFLIRLEQLSRTIFTPTTDTNPLQTVWFFERARGQYKNARIREGMTQKQQQIFDLKYPKNQLFTKEELSKYMNSYSKMDGKGRLLVGPHIVVRGNQKNYIVFMDIIDKNSDEMPTDLYFQDLISRAIIFKAAEKVYGVKPNALGDLRYIIVPYSIAWLNLKTNGKIDLFKIWKNQNISEPIRTILREIMIAIEAFIKKEAPGSLYGEWAKKEDCWDKVKEQSFNINLDSLKNDLISKISPIRTPKSGAVIIQEINQQQRDNICSIPNEIWGRILNWGDTTKELTDSQMKTIVDIKFNKETNRELSEREVNSAVDIIEKVTKENSELLRSVD